MIKLYIIAIVGSVIWTWLRWRLQQNAGACQRHDRGGAWIQRNGENAARVYIVGALSFGLGCVTYTIQLHTTAAALPGSECTGLQRRERQP